MSFVLHWNPCADLEELLEGLNQGKLQVFRKATNIVVALDCVTVLLAAAGWRAGLDDVRVQGALDQELRFGKTALNQRVCKVLEVLDEFLPYRFALQFRV